MNGIVIAAVALAGAFGVCLCGLGWQLLQQNGRILLRLDELERRLDELEFGGGADEPKGLPVGSEAPPFELPDLAGERKSLAQFRGEQVLLIFFNPDCGFCRELAPKLAAPSPSAESLANPMPEGKGGGQPLMLLVTTGEVEKNRQFFAENKPNCPVLLQKDGELAKAYQANGTPGGYLISPEGNIASELAMGSDALLALASGRSTQPSRPNPQALVQDGKAPLAANGDQRTTRFSSRSFVHSRIKRDGLKPGTPAPDFRLPRSDGQGELALRELRGRRILLVFSSPSCGPCLSLAPHLEKFHRQHPELALVMISKGEPKENRAKVREYGLTFPIVLQQQWEISRRYAMFTTPVAYLIDEEGIIACNVAVGNEAIEVLLAASSEQNAISLQSS